MGRSKAATVDVTFVDVSGVAVLGVSVDRPCRFDFGWKP